MKLNVAIRVRASRSKKKYDFNLSNRLFQPFIGHDFYKIWWLLKGAVCLCIEVSV